MPLQVLRRNAKKFILIVAVCGAVSAADPTIERSLHSLKIHWQSSKAGEWQLKTSQGTECARGDVKAGANAIHFEKIDNLNELSFESDAATTKIPAATAFSSLRKPEGLVNIYQLPVRTYLATARGEANTGKLRDLTTAMLGELKQLGVDYIWLTGVIEHARPATVDADVVKGEAGSYYAIYDYWDVSQQIGDLNDLTDLIARAHAQGIRVLIDFVSNHTARVQKTDVTCKQRLEFGRGDDPSRAYDPQNNYYYLGADTVLVPPAQPDNPGADGDFDRALDVEGMQWEKPAKVTGNNGFSPTPSRDDWFETVRLNYGYNIFEKRLEFKTESVQKTWAQMLDVASYWLAMGVDGFRVDFAHTAPLEFWRYWATELRKLQPEVYLLAEAYEEDSMRTPGFSYEALMDAGFDSVYNAKMYWQMRSQTGSGNMQNASFFQTPAARRWILDRGKAFTHYMENHDEIRTAHKDFLGLQNGDREKSAKVGLAYSIYMALMPGNFLLHGGQEWGEEATVVGRYAGDNGRTSIFDFVYQPQTLKWWRGDRDAFTRELQSNYASLLNLRKREPFRMAHSNARPNFFELNHMNRANPNAKWIGSYFRFAEGEIYLVVLNADPKHAHEVYLHLTERGGEDSHRALEFMRVENSGQRYLFEEVLTKKGWIPKDPNIEGDGIPGEVLFRAGGVPSGLFVGEVPPGTAYVFKVSPRVARHPER